MRKSSSKEKERKDRKEGKWMQHAVKPSRKGKFSAKAKRAGMSTHAYAEKERDAPGALGKEARLALVFEGHGRGKKSHHGKSRMHHGRSGRARR